MTLLLVDSVYKSFGGVRALDGCSMKVEPESITGLIGPNGAGKTTLFDVLTGLLQPDAGTVRLAGRETQGWSAHRVAHLGLARTFQMTRELQRLTVRENLLLAAPSQVGLSLWEALFRWSQVRRSERENLAKADRLIEFFSLERLRDEPAGALSGGQRKLLDLARALMTDPTIVLLDEPTAGVNPTLVSTIGDRIVQLREERNLTFFIVEHNMGFLETLSDTVVVMAEGKTLLEGPLEVAREHPEVLEAYLGQGMGSTSEIEAPTDER